MNSALSNNDNLNNLRKGWVKCTLCGFEFSAEGGSASGGDEKKAKSACRNCPMRKDCKLIKCPNCGFETPLEPSWLKSMRKRRKTNEDK